MNVIQEEKNLKSKIREIILRRQRQDGQSRASLGYLRGREDREEEEKTEGIFR